MSTLGGPSGGFPGGAGEGSKKNKKQNRKKAAPESDEDEEIEQVPVKGKGQAFDFSVASPGVANLISGGDPNFLQKLQDKISASLAAAASDFLETLSEPVKGRVYVLKELHEQRKKLETEFKKEYEALQAKYRALYKPLYDERKAIVAGEKEPSAEEIEAARTTQEEKKKKEQAEAGVEEQPKTEKAAPAEAAEDVKGVPGFWLQALKYHVDLREMVEPEDEPALMHLTDISWHPLPENPVSFVLEFHFSPNEFFEETVLAKTYHMQENPESGDLHFSRVDSPTITWKSGKNLCVKQVTKQQRKKGNRRGKGPQTRTITVEEPCNSFFHFFNPEAFLNLQPEIPEEDYDQFREDDYVMGTEIKDRLIPYAVLYYTGEMEQEEDLGFDDDEDDEDYDDDEGGDDDDDDDEGEGDYKAPATNAAKPECNQQ